MMDKLFSSKVLIVTLALLGAIYLYSLYNPAPDPDDAWIGEYTYWLAKDGHARSELMRGITQQEDYLIVHHKLLTLQGALFIKIFGFSLYSLKSVSLLYFVIFLFLFYYYAFKRKKLEGREHYYITTILLLGFPWVFKYSFIYRPEIMVMTLAFASWILLEKALEEKAHQLRNILLAGFISGLCFTAHLNGVVVAMAGSILLIINRRYKHSIYFVLSSLLAASLYLYDFSSAHGFSFWWYQFSESPSLDSLQGSSPLFAPFINLLNEHMRFFHNPKIIFFSAFAIFSLVTGYRYLKANRRNLSLYTLLLILLLGLTAVHKTRKYLLIYYPFLVILVSDVYFSYLTNEKLDRYFRGWRAKKTTRIVMTLLLATFVISSLYYDLAYSLVKFTPEENKKVIEKYVSEAPAGLNIVAPMEFIFNEIEDFHRIQADLCFTEMQKADPTITGAGFLEKTKSFDIRYIFLSKTARQKLGWDEPGQIELPEDFIILSDTGEEYLVFKRILK